MPLLGLALAVACAVVSAPARESLACGNGVELEVERTTILVAQAESTTNRGFHADALKYLGPMFPNGRPRSDYLGDRAKLVAARAIARTGGHFGLHGIEANEEAAEMSNLHLAGRFVQERLLKKPDDPSLRTDYAEVLANIPAKEAEARSILVELEKKDLMASAFGYAALARLRGAPRKDLPSWLGAPLQTLDRAPRVIDIARCERMAIEDGICSRESKSGRPPNAQIAGKSSPAKAPPTRAAAAKAPPPAKRSTAQMLGD